MNITVTFDYQIFCRQQYGGISRYIIELSKAVSSVPGFSARIFAPLHLNQYLRNDRSAGVGLFFGVDTKVGRIMRPLDDFLLKSANLIQPANIIHQTYYSEFNAPTRSAVVVTVHDMTHELFPHLWSKDDKTPIFKKAAVERADHVICVSESTKRDLMQICRVSDEKITVVHNGFAQLAPHPELAAECRASPSQADEPYILYVGNRGGYKNFARFARAFGASPLLRKNFRLVAFGGGVFSREERALLQSAGVRFSHVRSAAADNDSALATAYRNAAMLVYPSLYEGFGLPPLEAMSVGCPVAASNTGPIPEISGEAADLFDPYDVDAIRHSMEKLATDSDTRSALISKGHRRAKLFSWERCAKETTEVYRRVAPKHD